MDSLEHIIRSQLGLQKKAATGFYPVRCAVCDDKKVRGGFKFESDGAVIYNCFRGKCDANCVYRPEEKLTKKFKDMLRAFRVDLPEEVRVADMQRRKLDAVHFDEELYEKHHYGEVEWPEGVEIDADFFKSPEAKRYRQAIANRGMGGHVNFFGIPVKDSIGEAGIPLMMDGRVIGWQFWNYRTGKYTNYFGGNTDLIYFPRGEIPNRPIITEGIFDALSVPSGVAVLNNGVSKKQAYILRNTNPVLLPDRKDSDFMKVAKRYGWDIIIPPYKEKDANEAMVSHGRLVLAKMLRESIMKPTRAAEMKFNLWCSKVGG